MKQFRFVLLLLLLCVRLSAQDSAAIQTTPSKTVKRIVGYGIALQATASFLLEYQWLLTKNYHDFSYYSDGWFDNYSKGIDKAGHFYTSYFYFNALNECMKYAGFPEKSRLWVSTVLPVFYAFNIEMADGYTSYNFSSEDLLANSFGALYGLLQQKVSYLQYFKPKFSYIPSQLYIDNGFNNWTVTKDYNGHLYWMTFDLHNMLPKNLQRYWPAFLNPGIAYGINGYLETTPENLERKFCVGLDWNLSSFFIRNKTLKSLRNIIDLYHFPAPGLKWQGSGTTDVRLLLFN